MKKLQHGLCSCTENPWDRSVVLPRNSCTDADTAFCFLYLCVGYQGAEHRLCLGL